MAAKQNKALLLLVFIILSVYSFCDTFDDKLDDGNNLKGLWKVYLFDDIKISKGIETGKYKEINVPATLKEDGISYTGNGWYKKEIKLERIPEQNLVLLLGRIDDEDEVYFNGVKIGETKFKYYNYNPLSYTSSYGLDRYYLVPAKILKNDNIVSVRFINTYLDGGMVSGDIGIVTEKYFFDKYLYKLNLKMEPGDYIYFIMAGIFIAFAVYHLSLYVYLKQIYNIYLSAGLMSMAFYVGLITRKRDYFMGLDTVDLMKINIASSILIILFTNLFITEFFKVKKGKIFYSFLSLNIFFLMGLLVFKEFMQVRNVIFFWYPFFFPQMVYNIYVVRKSNSRESEIVGVSIYLLILSAVYDVLHDMNVFRIFENYIGMYGYLVMMTAMVIVVSRDYMNMYLEIIKLNKNLEKQVAVRTEKLKEAQNQLVITEKMAAMANFAGGIAHELNSPLGSIVLNTQMMQSDLKEIQDEKLKSHFEEGLEEVYGAAAKSKKIISHLLKYRDYKGDSHDGINSDVNMGEVLMRAIEISQKAVKEQRDIQFEINIQENLTVSGNEMSLLQVFTNIINNAIDALKQKESEPKIIIIRAFSLASNVFVEVVDNGIGMNDETKMKIFDPFFTTKTVGEGIGLGLTLSYEILKRHRAEIVVKSKLGEETLVMIKFNRKY